MNVLFAGFQASLLWVCLVGLLSIVGFAAFRAAGDMMSRLRELFGKSKVQGAFAMVAICGLVMYGGSKGTKTVSFPRTDIERAYLVDAGSYVSNDVVHVAFTTFLVPPEAPIFLAYWPDGSSD